MTFFRGCGLRIIQPEDWDENEPYEILDEEAVKPEGWLDNEPLTIPDPGKIITPHQIRI